jgi:HSP20 family molecular chaperone IbpA
MNRFTLTCSAALVAVTSLQTLASEPGIPFRPGFGPHGAGGTAPPPASSQRRIRQEIRVQRDRTPDGYQVRIYSGSEDPASIRVKIEGRSVLISSSESQGEEQSDDRGSYRYFRLSSRSSQRLSLPRDADLNSMKRTEKDGAITLTFARRDPFSGGEPGRQFPGVPGPAYGPGRGHGYGPGPGGWPGYGR